MFTTKFTWEFVQKNVLQNMNSQEKTKTTSRFSLIKRSAEAWASGKFKEEIVPVEIPQRKGEPIIFAEDEEYKM